MLITASANADSDVASITVIYPEVRDPYRRIFLDIIKGIEDELDRPVLQFVLNKDNEHKLVSWLEKKHSKIVIALGKKGLYAANNLPTDYNIIAGAILTPPNESKPNITGITLTPSPDKLFARLKNLSPPIKRVSIVYSEQRSSWLISYAVEAAKKHGIILNAIRANSKAEAATHYRDLINSDLGVNDAIWLPQDSVTVDHATILPMILKEAWSKQFIVFSSNPAYVKRGVLFALFPDNIYMGKSLGEIALDILSKDSVTQPGMLPLNQLKVAVNLRTADHLELEIPSDEKRKFNLVFPTPK